MKRELSLLFFTHLFPNPANPKLGTFFRNKVLALRRAGCRITVVSPVPLVPFPLSLLRRYREKSVPVRSGEVEGIKVYYPPFVRPPGAWFRPFEGCAMYLVSRALIRRLHRSESFDAVIGGMLTNDGHAALLAGRALGIPAYSYAIGSDIHTYPRNEPRVARLTRRLFSGLDGVFAVGPNFTRQIREEYPEYREKIRCNPLGVDMEVFCPNRSGDWRQELGFSEELSIGLFVGNLTRAKGLAELMDVIPRMRDAPVAFVLVGKGEFLEPLQKRIAEGAVGFDRCRVIPFLDAASLPRFFQNADFFLFPSHAEGSPTVLIEAIACGLPVLASDIPANHDAVTEGGNGRFFEVARSDQLESVLRKFLDSDDPRVFGAASRRKALAEFDSVMNARVLLQEISAH
jgi:glycosyltransferase involved in cell wall biosynthesis